MDIFITLEQLEIEEAQEAASVADKTPAPGSTVLDRVHQAMILFSAGRSEAMKRFLVDDGIGNDPRFWGLANWAGMTPSRLWPNMMPMAFRRAGMSSRNSSRKASLA